MYAGGLVTCDIQQAACNHSAAVIARDIGQAGKDRSLRMIPGDTHKPGNGQATEIIAVDIGDSGHLYAPHTSTHHIGYAGELRSVHVSAHNGSQCIYSQAVQTVHGREDTEIEESASDRVRALCGEILPKGEVDARFSFTDGLLLACLGIACPCQQQGQANK